MSLQKKLKHDPWDFQTIQEYIKDHKHIPELSTKSEWLPLEEVLIELGEVADKIRLDRDNALEWVKENILKESYEESGRDTTGLDFEAAGMAHAIQVFVNREVLGLLVEPSKEKTKENEFRRKNKS